MRKLGIIGALACLAVFLVVGGAGACDGAAVEFKKLKIGFQFCA